MFGNLISLEIENAIHSGTDGPTNPEDPSNKISKFLNMGSISIQKHEMAVSEILNMGSISFQKHEVEMW